MHLDFLRIDATHAVHVNAPIHFINEEVAEKKGGKIAHQINEIAVSCLPADIPEFIEVDVAGLEVGQTLHLSDITLPKGVTSDELAKGEDHDQAVASLNAPKVVKDEEEDNSAPVAPVNTTED